MHKKNAIILAGLVLVATGLWLFAPYRAVLTKTASAPIYINTPCTSASVQNAPEGETTLTFELSGKGIGHTALKVDKKQIKLLKIGLFSQLECHVAARVAPGNIIYLPNSMPFVARGVLTPPRPHKDLKEVAEKGIEWRQFTGVR